MKSIYTIPLPLFAILIMISCNNSETETFDKDIAGPSGATSNAAQPASPANIAVNTSSNTTAAGKVNPPIGQPGHQWGTPVGALLSTPAADVVTTTSNTPVMPALDGKSGANLNPAHGQPGHRCDIAVGAPLNGPAAQASAPTVSTQTTPAVQKTITASPPVTKTAPGMNPPHGQPGHKCDIAVGAPLNSPAAKPSPVVTTTKDSIPNVINSPLKPASASPIQTVPDLSDGSVRLNPAHGQPGHDCKIAVGKPLPGK